MTYSTAFFHILRAGWLAYHSLMSQLFVVCLIIALMTLDTGKIM
ncbi:MAG: hypothetical protein SD837_11420 [Candidatus Electrothrix scaldis]|nr:MAG: hypothetical protein SD837_11420 [Candidatus Electrothrix sp. GW3-3]